MTDAIHTSGDKFDRLARDLHNRQRQKQETSQAQAKPRRKGRTPEQVAAELVVRVPPTYRWGWQGIDWASLTERCNRYGIPFSTVDAHGVVHITRPKTGKAIPS
jgi:hypothetical protein